MNMDTISPSLRAERPINVETVDARNVSALRENGVAFHWWDSMQTSLHNHTHYEFFIITRGKTAHVINGERQLLSQNTLFFIRPRDCHQFLPLEGEPCTHINLAVTAERLEALCEAMHIPLAALVSESKPQHLLLDGTELSYFLNKAEQINYVTRGGGGVCGVSPVIVCEMLAEALALLYTRGMAGGEVYPEWFSALLRKVHSPEYIDCTAEDIYQMSGFSPPVVINCFKKYKGETIVSYLRKIKLECACELLRTTSLTTLEVAGRLGYDSLSHFNQIFKRHTGLTPRAYKKAARIDTGG